MKVPLCVTIDEGVVKKIDSLSCRYADGNRSRFIENLVSIALMDVALMKSLGLLDIAKAAQEINEKLEGSLGRHRARACVK